jgi:drug/metabolite transporter (DMT)-like permease
MFEQHSGIDMVKEKMADTQLLAEKQLSPVKPRGLIWRLMMIILLSGIFAIFYPLQKLLLETQTPATVTALRLGFANIIGFMMMMASGRSLVQENADHTQHFASGILLPLAVVAIFGNALPFLLLAWGQTAVDAGISSILAALMPFMTLILAHFFIANSRIDKSKITGFTFGFVGVVILFASELSDDRFNRFGHMAAIAASALSFAIATVAVEKMDKRVNPLAASFYVTLPGAILFGLMVILANEFSFSSMSLSTLIMAILLGSLTTISVVLMFLLVREAGAANASLPQYLTPIIALLLAALWLKETVPQTAILALLIILLGILISQGYFFKRK